MPYLFIFLPFVLIGIALVIIHSKFDLILNESNLVRQPLFWSTIIIPAILFFYFGCISWADHSPQLDSKGLINFYNISKIPLLLLASSVPLAAMVANLHRTIQTEAQINETKKKNANDIYYSHFKFYTEAFSKISTYDLEHKSFKKEISLDQVFKLYRVTFPSSNQDESHSTSINESYFRELLLLWENLDNEIKKHNSEYNKYLSSQNKQNYPLNNLHMIINEIELILIEICRKIFISGYSYKYSAIYNSHSNSILSNGKKILHSGFFTHSDMCDTIESVKKICLKIMDIINPQCFVIKQNELINSTLWLEFKLFTTLDIRGYFHHMPYRQPEFLP